MEENVNEALGIMQEEKHEASPKDKMKPNNGAENTLSIIADIVLVLGIIGSFICLFTLTTVKVGYKEEFNPIGFGISVSALLSTLISWSVMKVLANISLTLKGISRKMKTDSAYERKEETKPLCLFDYIKEPE